MPEGFKEIVGRSQPMREVYRQIRQAAGTDIPVLLIGETGTGKELVARSIHRRSQRSDGPFSAVNLGALPQDLVASELFGHVRGAFTGATEEREGQFERAHDGTIFLDEIASIPEKVQVSLLRLLERKQFQRLGGQETIRTNARLVAASNADLKDAVEEGEFREDLYYRLDVFRITLPPLRERPDDIPLLIEEFLKRYNNQFDKNVRGISPECVALLEERDWPGNVRELKNAIQRAVLVCEDDVLTRDNLPPRFRKEDENNNPSVSFKVGTPMEEIEREMIIRTLEYTRNNRSKAARLLDISRKTLYNKMDKYRIE
ncbi:MAG: sigma-54 interaction domain-containing protein [Planctomycetota bacterium]